jgi:hypothetical protein
VTVATCLRDRASGHLPIRAVEFLGIFGNFLVYGPRGSFFGFTLHTYNEEDD